MSDMNRRDFLRWIGAGTAIVSVPALTSCAKETLVKPTPAQASSAHGTYFDQFGMDSGKIRRIIQKGLSRGGDFCEVYLQHKVSHSVSLMDQEVNSASSAVDLGAGIRVLKGDATGYAYTEDLSEQALLKAADTAAAVADSKNQVELKALAAVAIESRYAIATPWTEVGLDKKMPIIARADTQSRAADKRIIKVRAWLSDESSQILVANSEGLLVEDSQPMAVMGLMCVAADKGRTETGYRSVAGRHGIEHFAQARVDKLVGDVVSETASLFEAVPAPVGEMPVVLAAGSSGILLHEAIGHGMEADFNRKGTSIYADKMGKRIAPPEVTIVDDGTQDNLRGAINVDDEGTKGQRTVLVEKGILRSYMHDRLSAQHYKMDGSTGSGRRQSFRYPPVPRMRSTYMLDGPHKPEEVIASVDKGIYAETFSNGQVAIGAGDFTFFLKRGRLIEKGKLTNFIKDANLIGSGPKVLETVDMVADDLKIDDMGWTCGKDGQRVPVSQGLPTVRAGNISVGGRKS